MNTCLKQFKTIKLPDSEFSAMLLRGRAPAKSLFFSHPLFSSLISFSLILTALSAFHLTVLSLSLFPSPPELVFSPLLLSLSCVLAWTCSHCFSIDWGLPHGCGPACVWSNGVEICSHSSCCPWRDLQNVSAPDVEFCLWKPTTICLLSIRRAAHSISLNL